MKRILSFIAVLIFGTALFAGFSYRLDLLSFDPLHEGYLADKDNPNLQFNYAAIYKGYPDHIYQDCVQPDPDKDEYFWDPRWWYFDPESRFMDLEPWAGHIKLGETIGLLRSNFFFDSSIFSPVSFDISMQGLINFQMEGAMADLNAYDGVYFIGGMLKVGDIFSMRAGLHHICTHYGDAVMKTIPKGERDDFWVTYKYVRMNGFVVGLSLTPYQGIRLYGEYNWLPKDVKSWRPVAFRPSWIDIAVDNGHIPPEYKAQIVNFGIELSYPIFPELGNTTLAYDCHAYEEGKIVYKHDDGSYNTKAEGFRYDENAPWLWDHGLVLKQEINDLVSFEIGWHHGRSPLHAFYYMDCPQWVYVGATVDPSATVTVYDSAR